MNLRNDLGTFYFYKAAARDTVDILFVIKHFALSFNIF